MRGLEGRAIERRFRAGTPRELAVIRGASLRVPAGSLCAIRGPSGSGKSTLLGILGLLDRPSGGDVLIDGRELGAAAESVRTACRRSRLGIAFQSPNLFRRLTALENVELALLPLRLRRRERGAAARGILERLGLGGVLGATVGELSGGEMSRVAFARAVARRPGVLLVDEPETGLDRDGARAIAGLLRELRDGGAAIVVVTHRDELLGAADQVLRMEEGVLSGSGAPVEGDP